MKLALVHDWLKEIGGAERVLIELHLMYPEAPVYVLFYDPAFVRRWLPAAKIHASFLQRVPFITRIYPMLAWLMPVAIESFDLSGYDQVLSSSVIFAKGLVLKPTTEHVCYCYSPTRQIWDLGQSGDKSGWVRMAMEHLLRLWDRSAADRVDRFVAISKTVQERIKKYYRRDSVVVYPPVGPLGSEALYPKRDAAQAPRLGAWRGAEHRDNAEPLERGDYRSSLGHKAELPFYLIVSRLYDYKNIDIAIQAFNKLGYPLVIIGAGPAERKLRAMAGKNISFLGRLNDSSVASHYAACRAFIMPQEEDFGLTAVEAMSYGKPVVALRRGGATETVVEGVTGEFFDDPIPEGLADAVRRLNEHYGSYAPSGIKSHAQKFSEEVFKNEAKKILA